MGENVIILEKGRIKVQRILFSTLIILAILICIFSFALAENDTTPIEEKIEVNNANNLAIIILSILVVSLGIILLVEVLSKKKEEKIDSYLKKAKKAAKKAKEIIDEVEGEAEQEKQKQETIKEQLKKARIHLEKLSPRERKLQEKLLKKRRSIHKHQKIQVLSEFDEKNLKPIEIDENFMGRKNKKKTETFLKLKDLGKNKKSTKEKKRRSDIDKSLFDELNNIDKK